MNWSPEQDAELRTLWRKGLTAAQIAGQLGILSPADYQDDHKRTLFYAEIMKL